MFRVTAQMLIKMMDKDQDDKIDDNEMSYDFDFEDYGFDNAEVSTGRTLNWNIKLTIYKRIMMIYF